MKSQRWIQFQFDQQAFDRDGYIEAPKCYRDEVACERHRRFVYIEKKRDEEAKAEIEQVYRGTVKGGQGLRERVTIKEFTQSEILTEIGPFFRVDGKWLMYINGVILELEPDEE